MTRSPEVRLDVLKCRNCGTLAVAINDHRITGHKCSGAWDVVRTERIHTHDIREATSARQTRFAEAE